MSVHTYIGARYIPRFMGAYDPTQIYEALDVVDNGLGTSYISKKQTPAGTPLTDTTYWAIYGASSGAIIGLQNQIDDMKDGTIPGSLQNQIDNKVSRLEDRVFLMIGDSYDTVNPGYSWIDGVRTNLGIPAANVISRAAGGKGFYPASLSNSWENYLIANPVSDPDAITDIVICGGTNDIDATGSNIITAMQSFDTYVRGLYPNLKNIFLGFIGWQESPTGRPKFRATCEVYRTTAPALGWYYLNGVENIMKNVALIRSDLTDYAHPTPQGVIYLAKGIANALATGACEVYYTNSVSFSAYTANVSINTGYSFGGIEILQNGEITFQYPECNFTAAQDLTGQFQIATCADLATNWNFNRFWNVNVYNKSTGELFPALLFYAGFGIVRVGLYAKTIHTGEIFALIANNYNDMIL